MTCWYADHHVEEAARRGPGKHERGWKKMLRIILIIVATTPANITSTTKTFSFSGLNMLNWADKAMCHNAKDPRSQGK